MQAMTYTVKPRRIAQSRDLVGAHARNDRCRKADQVVFLRDSFLMNQNIVAGVGVRLEVFHRQQTVLQFDFLSDPKCMHVEVAQFELNFCPHIGGNRNGGETDRFMQGISELGLYRLSLRQAMAPD